MFKIFFTAKSVSFFYQKAKMEKILIERTPILKSLVIKNEKGLTAIRENFVTKNEKGLTAIRESFVIKIKWDSQKFGKVSSLKMKKDSLQ